MEPIALLNDVRAMAVEAGNLIVDIYQQGRFEKLTKQDETPVTTADLKANDLLIKRLTALAPDIPILSEEVTDVGFNKRCHWDKYWLIDPLDGTGEFIAGSGDFAVNVALIIGGVPTLGVVHAPVSGVTYFATRGHGAFKCQNGDTQAIKATKLSPQQPYSLRVAVSRRQNLELITDRLHEDVQAEFIPFGSSTLKSCMVAEGVADCYLRIGPTGEWDTGAAQCVVDEAGGRILDLALNPLSYNERESLENPNFIVLGDESLPWSSMLKS
ncbi:3'(2'),5'-bisphosphate nucleotidase CysQ [Corallincola spongiicola]|uniref:3'(2'),5'-bisphosphate nucleotidase CysQ n=1 Tax=Corallincola spongiicola TaxID=2520508 RepID=A0ABY1WPV4_9GAMM|nr:3'(2'),5'-bisphosphate nucleotidase CysQ [Corallincola spongiicola]TAA46114.1 3'(2'),5'-bisphosphate nucleotidase [Corallincola spongiicola]